MPLWVSWLLEAYSSQAVRMCFYVVMFCEFVFFTFLLLPDQFQ